MHNCTPMSIRLAPDSTVHKGTSKIHKTDEKSPIWRCTFLHQYSIKINTPRHLAPILLHSEMIKNPNVDGETCTALLFPEFYQFHVSYDMTARP